MKKLIYLFAITLLITSVSCKKGDEPVPDKVAVVTPPVVPPVDSTLAPLPLKGTWQVYKVESYVSGYLASTTYPTAWTLTIFQNDLEIFEAKDGVNTIMACDSIGNTLNVTDYMTSGSPGSTKYNYTRSTNGQEYTFVKFPFSGTYDVLYLKK